MWIALTVIWTVVVLTSGWINLPRAQHMPHSEYLLGKLSYEAAAILNRTSIAGKPGRGGLVWTGSVRTVRMSNGAELKFPAFTTGEQTALVANEYRNLLHAEARERRWSYVVGWLALWLGPCGLLLVVGPAISRRVGAGEPENWDLLSKSVGQRTDECAVLVETLPHDGEIAHRPAYEPVFRSIRSV